MYRRPVLAVGVNDAFPWKGRDADRLRDKVHRWKGEIAFAVWAGNPEWREVVLAELGLEERGIVDLGPDSTELDPLGLIVCLLAGFAHSSVEVEMVVADSRGVSASTGDDRESLKMAEVLRCAQGMCAANGSVGFGALEQLERLQERFGSLDIPGALEYGIESAKEYLKVLVRATHLFLVDPGTDTWSSAAQARSLAESGGGVPRPELAEVNRAAKALARAVRGDASEIVGKWLDTAYKLEAREGRDSEFELIGERLVGASALCMVRGDLYRSRGEPTIAFLSYWRAFDLYVHSVALWNDMVALDRSGKFRLVRSGASNTEATLHVILDELNSEGIALLPERIPNGNRMLREARRIRNQHWLIHGTARPNDEVAVRVRGLVYDAVEPFDRGHGGRWRRAIRSLDHIDSSKRWLFGVLSSVVGQDALKRVGGERG